MRTTAERRENTLSHILAVSMVQVWLVGEVGMWPHGVSATSQGKPRQTADRNGRSCAHPCRYTLLKIMRLAVAKPDPAQAIPPKPADDVDGQGGREWLPCVLDTVNPTISTTSVDIHELLLARDLQLVSGSNSVRYPMVGFD